MYVKDAIECGQRGRTGSAVQEPCWCCALANQQQQHNSDAIPSHHTHTHTHTHVRLATSLCLSLNNATISSRKLDTSFPTQCHPFVRVCSEWVCVCVCLCVC